MFKILDALNVHHNRIEMYGLSEFKDSPNRLEKEYEILNIPTLIFFENGIEINRIVEFPVVNLLDDFSKILKKQSYKILTQIFKMASIVLKSKEEIELLRESALVVSKTLGMLASEIVPGITSLELDRLAETYIRDHGLNQDF